MTEIAHMDAHIPGTAAWECARAERAEAERDRLARSRPWEILAGIGIGMMIVHLTRILANLA